MTEFDSGKLQETALNAITSLQTRSRRDRKLIYGLAVSFAVDIVLTAVISVFAVTASSTANSNASLLRQVQAQQVVINKDRIVACESSNASRKGDITLWTTLLNEPGAKINSQQGGNISGKKQLDAFLAFIDKIFAPDKCT